MLGNIINEGGGTSNKVQASNISILSKDITEILSKDITEILDTEKIKGNVVDEINNPHNKENVCYEEKMVNKESKLSSKNFLEVNKKNFNNQIEKTFLSNHSGSPQSIKTEEIEDDNYDYLYKEDTFTDDFCGIKFKKLRKKKSKQLNVSINPFDNVFIGDCNKQSNREIVNKDRINQKYFKSVEDTKPSKKKLKRILRSNTNKNRMYKNIKVKIVNVLDLTQPMPINLSYEPRNKTVVFTDENIKKEDLCHNKKDNIKPISVVPKNGVEFEIERVKEEIEIRNRVNLVSKPIPEFESFSYTSKIFDEQDYIDNKELDSDDSDDE